MDNKRIRTLLRRAADEVPDVDTTKIMQAVRAGRQSKKKWMPSLAAVALAAALLLMLNQNPDVTVPPAAPAEPETYYMLVGPNSSPYPDPLSYGYIIVPVTQ